MMIPLSEGSGFKIIPEGTHIFKITDVEYKKDFGKLQVKMKTKEGLTHTERFSLLDKNGETNEPALNSFSYFAKTAMNNFELESIDHEDLIGHYIECEVLHNIVPSDKDPNKTVTFIKLTEKKPACAYEGEDEVITVEKDDPYDLNKILGM